MDCSRDSVVTTPMGQPNRTHHWCESREMNSTGRFTSLIFNTSECKGYANHFKKYTSTAEFELQNCNPPSALTAS